MQISFDSEKRAKTLLERGLDFADADKVFASAVATRPDDRKDYGEKRFITFGILDGNVVVIVWTPRNDAYRIISMRHANERERHIYQQFLG
ncbi:MAG: BrnT family toxin [Alphaproteobacteria bacterium]|jgi:uncharacterized DUF497 family protein|nr:BrnT family toxin [Alphaproteobacteria bacterium]